MSYQEEWNWVSIKLNEPLDERIWNSFTELHKKRWLQDSLFRENRFVDFYKEIIPLFQADNSAHFSYIEVDGSITSVWLTFIHMNKVYMYITASSTEHPEYGVGLILTHRIVQHYLQSGVKEIDFMRGSQEYKFYWSDLVRVNVHIRVINNIKRMKLLKAYTLFQINRKTIKSLLK